MKNICPLTGKECLNPKGIYITEKHNGVVQNFEICKDCYKDFDETNKENTKLKNGILENAKKLIEDIFSRFVSKPEPPAVVETPQVVHIPFTEIPVIEIPLEEIPPPDMLKCSLCGFTLDDLTHSSRLGCGQCYETFKPHLLYLINQYHKSVDHNGKYPAHQEEREIEEFFDEYDLAQYQIASLESKLKDAIDNERYEEAAVFRDTIAALKFKVSEMRPKTSEDQ